MGEPKRPPEPRLWLVPRNLVDLIAHVTRGGDPDEVPMLDPDEAARAWADADSIAQRIGGRIAVEARRVRQSDGVWVTYGLAFRHTSYVPNDAPQDPQATVVEDLKEEPEPALAD